MDAQTLNKQLRNLYTEHWNALKQAIPSRSGYSYPLLMDANPSYAHAPVKLFVVGQQAFRWGVTEYKDWGLQEPPTPVENLMRLYDTFNRAENYKLTPFWDAAYQLQALLNPNGDRYGLMWSNLVRVDADGERVPMNVEEAVCSIPLLAEEIKITSPNVVVFFTGPKYEERLKTTFPGIQIKPRDDLQCLAKVAHPQLPPNSYRTYHPKYLRLNGGIEPITSKIAELVRQS